MDPAWEVLAPGVIRQRMPGWDETVGAVAGATGLLVVDAGATLRDGARIRSELHAGWGRQVTHLALTHPHFDHVLGAGAFSGVRTYATVGFGALLADGRETLADDAVRHGVDRARAEEAAEVLPRPRHEVSGHLMVDLGDRRVVLADLGPGHTGHDLVALVPDAGVVFCGDLVEESGEPQAGPDAHPAWWPGALDRLLALGGERARYVPGHGAVVDAAFVRAQRAALARRFGGGTTA